GHASVVERFGIVGIASDRFVIARDRLVESPQRPIGVASVAVGETRLWIERDRPIEARQRLVEALQRGKDVAAAVVNLGGLRRDLQRCVEVTKGLVVTAKLTAYDAEIMQPVAVHRLDFDDAAETPFCFVKSAGSA